ncbi:hypothetical protein Nepgr_001067 [Nepenthes gracilis]|uniref:Uncharacterized protein n=1 Tax=Nepenthes gracilis TaxID=150966 RepID=A0AAD3P6E5_NEPGR|nr:hypothetical protein Nepgr_001067 [Nepenthes gracilis]
MLLMLEPFRHADAHFCFALFSGLDGPGWNFMRALSGVEVRWLCQFHVENFFFGGWQEALREYREQGRCNSLEIWTRQPRNSINGDINSSCLEASLGRNEARQPAFHANMPRHVSTSDNPIKKQRE